MELSEKLKFFRSLKGWSQEAMAEKLDISASEDI
jgi:transcriptional regulator with XRE-family HTH domain